MTRSLIPWNSIKKVTFRIPWGEFKVYFQIIAPDISEDEVTHSFNVIDSNKDDEISCEELLSTFSMVLKKQNYYYNIIIKKIIFSVWAFQYLYIQWKYLNSYAA